MRALLLLLVSLVVVTPAYGDEPAWVDADIGRVNRGGRDLIFAVAELETDGNIGMATTVVQNRALARLADLVRECVPAGGGGGGDLFAEMGRSEAGVASERVTLRNAQLATWRDDDEYHGLAMVPADDLLAAVDDWPADPGTSKATKAELRRRMAALAGSADNLPRPSASDMVTSSDKPPWVDYGCGSYQGKKGRVFFGVGIVAGIKNHALARSTSDNRARVTIARCIQLTVTGSEKFSTSQNLWGVMISSHWFGPDGEIYALAEVPKGMLPNPSAPEPRAMAALMKEVGRAGSKPEPTKPPPKPEPEEDVFVPPPLGPEPSKPSPPRPDPPPAAVKSALVKHKCTKPRRGKGMRVAMGVIGPEAAWVRQILERELRGRGFSLASGAPDGQLALRVVGSRDADDLAGCLIEVELMRGAETATRATYACGLGGDRDEPERVRVVDLKNQVQLIKCNIADNLWLAAKQHRARPRPKPAARKRPSGGDTTMAAQKHYIAAYKLETRADYRGALGLLKKCIKASPGFAKCYKSMGLAYMQLGQNAKAKVAYEKYLSLAPDAPDASVVRRILKTL